MRAVVGLILLSFTIVGQSIYAFSFSTPDGSCMNSLTTWTQMHEQEFGGLPESWEVFEKTLRGAFTNSPVRVRERYAILPPHARPLLDGRRGEIFLISRRPFRNLTRDSTLLGFRTTTLTEPLRYGLRRLPEGAVQIFKLAEPDIQRIFQRHGSLLPVPDTLPEREWIVALERRTRIANVILCAVLVVGLLFSYRLFVAVFRPKRLQPQED